MPINRGRSKLPENSPPSRNPSKTPSRNPSSRNPSRTPSRNPSSGNTSRNPSRNPSRSSSISRTPMQIDSERDNDNDNDDYFGHLESPLPKPSGSKELLTKEEFTYAISLLDDKINARYKLCRYISDQ